jgi:hypothetical protein
MAAFVSFTTGVASRSVTVPAGTDRLLVAIAHSNASTAARTATYNGVSMSVASTANGWTQIFYMLNPPAGSATMAVTGANISSVVAAHYTGIGSFQSGQQASTASASFSPNTGGAIVFGMVAGSTTHTPVASTNERQEGGDYYADRLVTTSGTVTVGVTTATDPDYAGAIFLDSVNASGSINAPKATSTGTATVTTGVDVSGSINAPKATSAGTASVIVSVTGSINAPKATSAGTALTAVSASGNITAPKATSAGFAAALLPGTDVSAALNAPLAVATGTVTIVVSVSGNITAPVAISSGSVEPIGTAVHFATAATSGAHGIATPSEPFATYSTPRARGAATET